MSTKEEDKTVNEEKNTKEELSEDMTSELVTELSKIYPNTPRGIVFEAVMGCKNESFLTLYLQEQEAKHTYVDRELTIGDLFSTGDNKEMSTVVQFGKKAKLSKALTIGAAIGLSLAKSLYSIVTDDVIKKDLDEIDITHSEELLAKAKALAKNDGLDEGQESKDNNNKKETK